MFPQEVLDDMNRGQAYLSDLNAEVITDLKKGCSGCGCCGKSKVCLMRILSALDYKASVGDYDTISQVLYEKLIFIIGDYVIKIPPSVDAGSNQSVPMNEDAMFSGTVTPGSSAIVSLLWTVVSGTATLMNADTLNVTVIDFGINTTLKLTAVDENGLSDSDTVNLVGTGDIMRVYYRLQDTNVPPNEAAILASSYVDVLQGSDYIVPINAMSVKFVLVFEPNSEPYKDRWKDTLDPDNNGVISSGNTFAPMAGIGSFRGYTTSYKTSFSNPIQFIKGPPQS